MCRGGSKATATSKMEHFVIIVNGCQPLTIITKRFILDGAAALDPPLNVSCKQVIDNLNNFSMPEKVVVQYRSGDTLSTFSLELTEAVASLIFMVYLVLGKSSLFLFYCFDQTFV